MKVSLDSSDFDRAYEAAPDGFRRIATRVGIYIEGEARKRAARDLGELQRSIESMVRGRDIIIKAASHGRFVEFGRRPGKQPPIKEIEGWAKRHGIPAYLVARKIGQKGTKPQPFMQPAVTENNNEILRMFKEGFEGIFK